MFAKVDAEGVQNPLTVLPTRLGLSVRAIDGPVHPPTPAGYSQLATGSAPFQSTPGGEAFQVRFTGINYILTKKLYLDPQ